MGTRLIPSSLAISLRSTRSPVRSLPVSTWLRMNATTWSFSLAPYVFGIVVSGLSPAAIAPAAQRLGAAQVVVRAVDSDGQQCHAQRRKPFCVGDQAALVRVDTG